jgi:hypothetical protein
VNLCPGDWFLGLGVPSQDGDRLVRVKSLAAAGRMRKREEKPRVKAGFA